MDTVAPIGERNIQEFEADLEIKTNIENLMHAKGRMIRISFHIKNS